MTTKTATKNLWHVYVTFGPCELPAECLTPTQDRDAIVAAYEEAMAELSTMGRQSWTGAHSWLHGCDTEDHAQAGDCSYGTGTHGRIV